MLSWKKAMGRQEASTNWVSTGKVEQFAQDVIDIHPLQWQIDTNKEFDKETPTTFGGLERSHYTVISWQELSKDDFEEFEGQF